MNAILLSLYRKSQDLMGREEGQDLVENALMIALIALGAITILNGIGSQVVATLSAINSAL
jgi:Flp pilus assembly pilin Flp